MAKRKKIYRWQSSLLVVGFLLCGVIFSSIAIVLAIGMLPTLVAGIVDRSKGKVKTLTVGSMNFAGCAPFIVDIWKRGGTFEVAMGYLIQPQTIVIIFLAAAMGYLIDWAMTGIVSSIMVQRARKRLKDIEVHQKDLVERWGPEVSGSVPLDEYGFAKETFDTGSVDATHEVPALKLP